MAPWIDEHVSAVGEEVRELARLHAELARLEMRGGVRRLVGGICLLGFAVLMATLVLVAADVAVKARPRFRPRRAWWGRIRPPRGARRPSAAHPTGPCTAGIAA